MKERLWTICIWCGILILAGSILIWTYRANGVHQPVPFNHKKHVSFGIACESCHLGSKDSEKAEIPNVSVCVLCHQPGKENPKTGPELEFYIRNKSSIPWKRIYQLPPHVHFSHQRHVSMGNLKCNECHGEIEKMEKPLSRQPKPLQMSNCRSCHAKEKVSLDCLACHR